MAALPGTNENDIIIGTKKGDVIDLGEGVDQAFGLGGGDEIYGDQLTDFVIVEVGTTNTTPETFTFDSDSTLNGNKGNDLIYGDLVTVSFQATGTSSITLLQNKEVEFGSEEDGIFGSDGKDILYGDLDTLELTAEGGTTALSSDFVVGNIALNGFTFGHDNIWGGAGNDVIYGDLLLLDITATGGTDTAVNDTDVGGVVFANDFIFGHDDIFGEAGRDTIYGDLLSLDITATGGASQSSGGNAGADVRNTVSTFGEDNIDGGAGSDTIYGDLLSLNMTAEGGDVGGFGAAEGVILDNTFDFGVDDIRGGAGGDTIYGDLLALNMQTTPGISASGAIENNPFSFGDDVLDGGSNADTLYGDFLELNLVADLDKSTLGTVSEHIVIEDDDGNIYTFGNDLLTGGTGSDVFSFTLLAVEAFGGDDEVVMPGDDQITDFDFSSTGKHDTIEFRDVIDIDGDGDIDIFDLEAVTSVFEVEVTGNNKFDLLIQFEVEVADGVFEKAGSITFLDFEANPTAPEVTPTSIVDLVNVIDIVPA